MAELAGTVEEGIWRQVNGAKWDESGSLSLAGTCNDHHGRAESMKEYAVV